MRELEHSLDRKAQAEDVVARVRMFTTALRVPPSTPSPVKRAAERRVCGCGCDLFGQLEELAGALQRNDQHMLDTLRTLRHDTEVGAAPSLCSSFGRTWFTDSSPDRVTLHRLLCALRGFL